MERFRTQEETLLQGRRLRGMKRKEDQKKTRQSAFHKNRALETPSSVASSKKTPRGTPKVKELGPVWARYTKEEQEERERERLEDLKKWQEKRKKVKELIKLHQRPAFHTGVVVPDKPKYLDAEDDDIENHQPNTPWKSKRTPATASRSMAKTRPGSTMKSTLKNAKTPSTSWRLKPKSLKFHTGVTPQAGVKPPASVTQSIKRRSNQSIVKKIINSGKKSFAPKGFTFQAPDGMKPYNLSVAVKSTKKKVIKRKSKSVVNSDPASPKTAIQSPTPPTSSNGIIKSDLHIQEDQNNVKNSPDFTENNALKFSSENNVLKSLQVRNNELNKVDQKHINETKETSFTNTNMEETKSQRSNRGRKKKSVMKDDIQSPGNSTSQVQNIELDNIDQNHINETKETFANATIDETKSQRSNRGRKKKSLMKDNVRSPDNVTSEVQNIELDIVDQSHINETKETSFAHTSMEETKPQRSNRGRKKKSLMKDNVPSPGNATSEVQNNEFDNIDQNHINETKETFANTTIDETKSQRSNRGRKKSVIKDDIQSPGNTSQEMDKENTPKNLGRRKSQRQAKYTTPPTAKLRARTPCSRSTKRSRSVHCNRLSLGSCQPTPRRKSKKINSVNEDNKRRSASLDILSPLDTNKLNGPLDEIPTTPDMFDVQTPKESGNPRVGMSSHRRKLLATKVVTPLEKMFMDLPMGDLDLETLIGQDTPKLNDTLSDAEVELMDLLKVKKPAVENSPEPPVWSDTDGESDGSNEIIKREPPKTAHSPVSILKKKTKESKLNVSFVGAESRKRKSAVYPITPIPSRRQSRSSKVPEVHDLPSPSDFNDMEYRVSLLPGLYDKKHTTEKSEVIEGDLISFDTPVSKKPKRKSSHRNSLLGNINLVAQGSPAANLLSFDSPKSEKKTRKSKAVETPVRRSMRLRSTPGK